MAGSNAVEHPIRVGFDMILKDLMRDEEDLLHVKEADNKQQEKASRIRKRSGSKQRTSGRKSNVADEKV